MAGGSAGHCQPSVLQDWFGVLPSVTVHILAAFREILGEGRARHYGGHVMISDKHKIVE